MDATSTTAAMPSVSTLTGTVKPATAAAFIEASFKTLKGISRNLLSTPISKEKPSAKLDAEAFSRKAGTEVDSLSTLASRHLTHLDKGHSTGAYSKPSTPLHTKHTTDSAAEAAWRLLSKPLHSAFKTQPTVQTDQSTKDAQPTHTNDASASNADKAQPSSSPKATASRPGTSSASALLDAILADSKSPGHTRPGTALSIQDLSLPRPCSKMARMRGLPGSLSASWSGPLSSHPDMPGSMSEPSSPTGQKQSLSRLGTPNRAAAFFTKPSPLQGSRPATADVAAATATAGSSSQQDLLASVASSRLGTPAGRTVTVPTLGGASKPLEAFRVTRGMVFSIFTELDPFDTGKVTFSSFEEAALTIGMRDEQIKKLFSNLDPAGRGYCTLKEWGGTQLEKTMGSFTRLYVQKTRGVNGKPRNMREVKSLNMAVQMAMTKLSLKNNGKTISHERLMDAFEFIDRDQSGQLDKSEIEDAFTAMGIYVAPDVVDTMMQKFDSDGSGSISYKEFIGALFPTLGRSYNIYG